jgi:hypothetical protein
MPSRGRPKFLVALRPVTPLSNSIPLWLRLSAFPEAFSSVVNLFNSPSCNLQVPLHSILVASARWCLLSSLFPLVCSIFLTFHLSRHSCGIPLEIVSSTTNTSHTPKTLPRRHLLLQPSLRPRLHPPSPSSSSIDPPKCPSPASFKTSAFAIAMAAALVAPRHLPLAPQFRPLMTAPRVSRTSRGLCPTPALLPPA